MRKMPLSLLAFIPALCASAGLMDSIRINTGTVAWLGRDQYLTKVTRMVLPAGESAAGTVKVVQTKTPGKIRVRVTVTPSPTNHYYFCGQRHEFVCGWSVDHGDYDGAALDTVDANGVKRINRIRRFPPGEERTTWGMNRQDYTSLVFATDTQMLRVTPGENCSLGVSHYGSGYTFDAWYVVPDPASKPAFDKPVSYDFTFEDLTPAATGGSDAQRLKPAFPKPIKCVGVVSPASPLEPARLARGVKMLEAAGLRVKVTPTARTERQAPAADRARDFLAVWTDPEVDVVLATRGGLGGEEILPLLDWETMKKTPKRFVGFSNMTCILNAMVAHGVSHPIAGPNLGSLERSSTPDAIARLGETLAGAALAPVRLERVNAAAKKGAGCRGRPLGGHVLVLSRKTPAPHFPDTTGRIVFLEIGGGACAANDVRIWIREMEKRGVFATCAGVVLCDFRECGTPEAIRAMQQDFADGVSAPVYRGYPFGHAPRSYAIDFEREAVVSPDGVLTFAPAR